MSHSENSILSAQIPRTLRDELYRLAQEQDRSMSAEVRSALRLHLRLAEDAGGYPETPSVNPAGRREADSSGSASALRQPTGQETP
jgi:hypothetical protein